jgi:hypothetical protein
METIVVMIAWTIVLTALFNWTWAWIKRAVSHEIHGTDALLLISSCTLIVLLISAWCLGK